MTLTNLQLREIWSDLISKSTRKDGKLGLNAFTWLNKVTLDIIGLAGDLLSFQFTSRDVLIARSLPQTGFDYTFNSLHSSDEKQNELYDSIRSMFTAKAGDFLFVLQLFFPFFRILVSIYTFRWKEGHISPPFQPSARTRSLNQALEVIQRIGSQLIQDKKAALLAELSSDGSGTVEKQDVQGHDLLSLLIRSNIASDMPESMRMSDSEILGRKCLPPSRPTFFDFDLANLEVPTFLIAGHETTR